MWLNNEIVWLIGEFERFLSGLIFTYVAVNKPLTFDLPLSGCMKQWGGGTPVVVRTGPIPDILNRNRGRDEMWTMAGWGARPA